MSSSLQHATSCPPRCRDTRSRQRRDPSGGSPPTLAPHAHEGPAARAGHVGGGMCVRACWRACVRACLSILSSLASPARRRPPAEDHGPLREEPRRYHLPSHTRSPSPGTPPPPRTAAPLTAAARRLVGLKGSARRLQRGGTKDAPQERCDNRRSVGGGGGRAGATLGALLRDEKAQSHSRAHESDATAASLTRATRLHSRYCAFGRYFGP